ncbi:MAG TPA: hypothetical protein VM778_12015 [Gemmatimonadota bacterium]|nr:hypothetical protein [Gemmatimonadota bacterium]
MERVRAAGIRAVLAALALAGPAVVAGVVQDEPRVVVERTDLRWSNVGRRLGWLGEGARIDRIGGRDGWTRARVRGWTRADGLVPAGERLAIGRSEVPLAARAGGDPVGGLVQGVEVRRVGGEGQWYEIELIGWLPDETVATPPAEGARAPAEAVEPRPAAPERPAPASAADPATMSRLSARAGLRAVPEGPVLADLPAGLVVRGLETRGGWTRVVVEGWVPAGAVQAGVEGDIDPEVVATAPPGTFVGRTVTWTLEHVAVQQADEWRTDFRRGETFELARVPGMAGRYVYLVLPERLAPRFRELAPFERIRVSGTIRTGRSQLTGNPIVDVTRILP